MGNIADINKPDPLRFGEGKEGAVIRQILDTKVGGVTLDLSDFKGPAIYAGSIVYREKSTGKYKLKNYKSTDPQPSASDIEYVGLVISTSDNGHPNVGVLTRGKVNPICMPYDGINEEMITSFATAFPHIIFEAD